jgi:hypothetical protein
VIDGLEKAIEYRNELITEVRRERPSQEVWIPRYMGVRTADGMTDSRFQMNIEGLAAQTDDCIFFSRLLMSDLRQHGKKLRRKHGRRLRMFLPKVSGEVDWSIAERQGLFPPDDEYRDWLNGFKAAPSRWTRLVRWVWLVRGRLALRSKNK